MKQRKLIEHKLELFARPSAEAEEGFELILVNKRHAYYMNDEDIRVDTVSVTFREPPKMTQTDFLMKAIQTLEDKQRQARANAEMTVRNLQKKIDELKLLTYQPDATPSETEVVDVHEFIDFDDLIED